MADIKEDFKEWLIKNKKYKTSTSKIFFSAINKVCKSFFDNHSNWQSLAQNVVPILVYYNECNNHEYYISADETDILEKHFNNHVLKYLRSDTNYNKDIFPNIQLSFIYNAKEYIISEIPLNLVTSRIKAFQFIINQATQNAFKVGDLPDFYTLAKMQNVFTGDLSVFFNKITTIISDNYEANKSCAYLHLQYTEKPSKQITKALWLFYEYINEKVPSTKPSLGYGELKNLIICINNAHDGLMQIRTLVPWTGNQAKKIEANNIYGYLYSYEVAEAFECSLVALRKLKKQGRISTIMKNGKHYHSDDINSFLDNSFHKVMYSGVDYNKFIPKNDSLKKYPKIWCNREKAAKVLNCNVSTIDSYKNNGVLTYIEIIENSALFYVPELKKIAKILKYNPRRALNALKIMIKKSPKNNML